MTPIIIVAGKAGSGKDTVAAHIAKNYNGICIAQADPMKQLVAQLFKFTEQQLWGPSEFRNTATMCNPMAEDLAEHVTRLFCSQMGCGGDKPLMDWFRGLVGEYNRKGVLAPRTVLQTLGTEWGREWNPRMWIERAIRDSRNLLEGGYSYTRTGGAVKDGTPGFDYAIITDGRFRNEVLAVDLIGGASLRINRPSQDAASVGIAGHRSEKELDTIPGHFYSGTIMNDSTLDNLYANVNDEMVVQFGDTRCWK